MPQVTANHINLYYETYGAGDPLVFIHGFAVDHLVFSSMPSEYQATHQVVLLDNRGSGQSECPDYPYTIDMMADDVAELCRVLGLGPAHFVGHSMGGMILQRFAYRYPQQVKSMVLCSTDVKIDIRYALTAKSRLVFMQSHCPPRAMIENGMGWSFSSEFLSRPGMVEDIIELRLANPFPITEVGYRNQLHALLTFDASAWVPQIRTPCLVIGSDLDMIIAEANVQGLATIIPGARYESVSGVGHVPFLEKPEIFHRLVQNFLTQNRP